jgi:hypothetical protein
MDQKQSSLLSELHQKITTGDFGETEVHSLWGLLRQDEPANVRSPVRDLGDFVGHRERDRGGVHEHIRLTRENFEKNVQQGGVLFTGQPAYSQKEVAEGLDKALARHNLAALQEWAHVAVQFVTLAMLQGVGLLDEKCVRFGGLGLGFTRRNVQLLAYVESTLKPHLRLVFPVLLVQNRWYPMEATAVPFTPPELVRVSFHGGVAAILGAQR